MAKAAIGLCSLPPLTPSMARRWFHLGQRKIEHNSTSKRHALSEHVIGIRWRDELVLRSCERACLFAPSRCTEDVPASKRHLCFSLVTAVPLQLCQVLLFSIENSPTTVIVLPSSSSLAITTTLLSKLFLFLSLWDDANHMCNTQTSLDSVAGLNLGVQPETLSLGLRFNFFF